MTLSGAAALDQQSIVDDDDVGRSALAVDLAETSSGHKSPSVAIRN